MRRERKLGRGLEDFSHFFLSSGAEKADPLSSKPNGGGETKGPATPARVICITSNRKVKERTFLTVNLALEIAGQGKKVLVVDADFSLPRLCMLMGNSTPGSILHLISNNGEKEISTEFIHGVSLITLDVDISDLSSLGASEQTSIMRFFSQAEEKADILLVTVSSTFIRHMIAILKASSDIVVITPQQVNELVYAYGMLKTVFQVNSDACVGIVSSRISVPDQAEAVFEKMQKTVKRFLDKPLCNYGYLPDDPEISQSIASRKPLALSAPSSQAVKCIAEISQSIFEKHKWVTEKLSIKENCCSFSERFFDNRHNSAWFHNPGIADTL